MSRVSGLKQFPSPHYKHQKSGMNAWMLGSYDVLTKTNLPIPDSIIQFAKDILPYFFTSYEELMGERDLLEPSSQKGPEIRCFHIISSNPFSHFLNTIFTIY